MPITDGKMKRVLVIDDDQALAMMVVEAIEMLGFEPLYAFDGATGIELAVAKRPDLILCDVSMPRMDGFQTIWQLRQTEVTANIPSVLCSGYTDEGIRAKAIQSGATCVIGKPLSISDLCALLKQYLAEAA